MFFPDREITAVEDFGNDVNAVLKIEIDKVWLALFQLVNGGFLAGR